MPLTNLFKNCVYYWGYTLFVGYSICHPLYTPQSNTAIVYAAFACMFICECVNGAGPLFALVSCPNYTAEVSSWICFTIATHSLPALLFTLTGFLQMAAWAMKKHRGYIKTYGEEYRKLHRKAIVPFVY
ncbi:hypothetical protein BLSTO_04555 [Blastocystis sp. subtype 1]